MKKVGLLKPETDLKHSWLKRLGLWGFLFFAAKGMMWVLVTFVLARYGLQ